jgi:nicotinamide-nucleotide amidase
VTVSSPAPEAVIELLEELGETVGCAESLTGGLLCAALTDIPGASAVMMGGVVSYSTQVKESVLGVDGDLLAHEGAVHGEVALQMARGVCRVVRSTVGVATTGVAGPTEQDGQPVGRVFLAVATGNLERVRRLELTGGRNEIRRQAVAEALALLLEVLGGPPDFDPEESP